MCGGTCRPTRSLMSSSGLSPRVRGNRLYAGAAGGAAGSIPACAGEPLRAGAPGGVSQVYPRVCGGTAPAPALPFLRVGLSPRVRGNRLFVLLAGGGEGSIPACAGEPIQLGEAFVVFGVYPRVCGGTR